MPRTLGRGADVVDSDVFLKFGGAFTSTAWRPYFVRWERHARLHFDHLWLVRAEIEVPGAGTAFVRVFLSPSLPRRGVVESEPGFERLRRALEGCGYELRDSQSPNGLFLKRFRPTARQLAAARREVEALFWPGERTVPRGGSGRNGITGALRDFSRTPTWMPSSCGWSRRFRLVDGTAVTVAMLLHQRYRRGQLRPDVDVLLFPPQTADRRRLRKLGSVIRDAGYTGKFETAHPAGGKPFLVAHYSKRRFPRDGPAAERRRLDALADAMRRLR